MKKLEDITTLENVPVLVRVGLNVPLVDGIPSSTFRLRRALQTILYLQEKKAKVIVISHIGRDPFATLKPVYEYLREHIPRLAFSEQTVGAQVRDRVSILMPGDVLLLENLRRNAGEVGNDPEFAKALASLADVFVQDAFDTCHRNHASIIGVPELLPSYAGKLVCQEVEELSKALRPKQPAFAIIGGAKFGTKSPLIEKLLGIYDRIFIGGALGNDLLKARGYPIGRSVTSGKEQAFANLAKDARIIGPLDVIVSSPKGGGVRELSEVTEAEMILDAGPKTIAMLEEQIQNSRTILWNGPLGHYEKGYQEGTEALAQAIANAPARTYAIIGGGDTVVSTETLGVEHSIDFISTGGGAMLDYLIHKTLPGLEALS